MGNCPAVSSYNMEEGYMEEAGLVPLPQSLSPSSLLPCLSSPFLLSVHVFHPLVLYKASVSASPLLWSLPSTVSFFPLHHIIVLVLASSCFESPFFTLQQISLWILFILFISPATCDLPHWSFFFLAVRLWSTCHSLGIPDAVQQMDLGCLWAWQACTIASWVSFLHGIVCRERGGKLCVIH